MDNKKVIITDGEYKNKTGVIVDIHYGCGFAQYLVALDEGGKITVYHDEVKELE